MTVTQKYTTPTAAGAEVHSRAERYVAQHEGTTYREAVNAVLANDRQLAQAYSSPATRRVRMATTDKRSQPAVSVPVDVEAEIKDWITRALEAGMAGSLPGALGQLSIEADSFRKIGMPIEEAARRAMDSSPSLVAMARLLLTDIRRNTPEKPSEETQGQAPGDIVHMRAKALAEKHRLDYHEAMGVVLSEDPALKSAYART